MNELMLIPDLGWIILILLFGAIILALFSIITYMNKESHESDDMAQIFFGGFVGLVFAAVLVALVEHNQAIKYNQAIMQSSEHKLDCYVENCTIEINQYNGGKP